MSATLLLVATALATQLTDRYGASPAASQGGATATDAFGNDASASFADSLTNPAGENGVPYRNAPLPINTSSLLPATPAPPQAIKEITRIRIM